MKLISQGCVATAGLSKGIKGINEKGKEEIFLIPFRAFRGSLLGSGFSFHLFPTVRRVFVALVGINCPLNISMDRGA